MRFYIQFISNKEVKVPSNIRSFFISFIKKVFENTDKLLYSSLFNSKKAKPYVFSPYFGEEFKEGKIGKDISFIFSSGDFSLISSFWNGILLLKEKKLDYIEIEGEKFNLNNIKLLPNKKIIGNEVIFKTIGISVLTDPEVSAKDFKNWYIIPEKDKIERFKDVLRKRTEERIKYIKGIEKKIELEFSIPEEATNSDTVVPHYDGYVRGFRGIFCLKGEPEILQFLYDYGFGVRTGQGFGLLEIVKQI
ncbi:MAG TPA: CRISPR-associated endoribonuclease Cas6 [bacterium]|nr:CRISPR-associated endoribonuclease Cas6 [bacterium]HOM27079.1 CRISPR-associated endoribonuclease Cas6 [bacterium]